MAQFCTWTCSPGPMSVVAKPMICPNFRIGSPFAIGRMATLCPAGTRCAVRTPSPASSVLGRMSTRATTVLSKGLRRTVIGRSGI